MHKKIAVLPGDGIGPAVVGAAVDALKAVEEKYGHQFTLEEGLIGGIAIDEKGDSFPWETDSLCRESDAVLLGAVGGPKWDHRPQGTSLLGLRLSLGAFANIRPVFAYEELLDISPVKPEICRGVDFIIVRELTGGLYYGNKGMDERDDGTVEAFDTMFYTDAEIRRVTETAFSLAATRRNKVTVADKANVLITSRLWRRVVEELHREQFSSAELDFLYVDNCAMQIILAPTQFDIILTENTFGDILTDEASVLSGSIGMLPSASIGGKVSLYEPCHGSAPDLEGKDMANPIGTILSVAMMLRHSFMLVAEAGSIEGAVQEVLRQGYRTADLGPGGTKSVGTSEMSRLIQAAILKDQA